MRRKNDETVGKITDKQVNQRRMRRAGRVFPGGRNADPPVMGAVLPDGRQRRGGVYRGGDHYAE